MKTLIFLITVLSSTVAFGFNFASPKDPSAKLILDHAQETKQLFPVSLISVNGENVNKRSSVVWLEPGQYELKFSAVVNRNLTSAVKSHRVVNTNHTINILVAADKSYYIAYDASGRNTEDWQPVVYKVK